jgi:hypothetical protein
MSYLSDADPMDQDSLSADEANEQLHRELRQSGQSAGVATQLAQQTIPIGISHAYVKDWDTANAFRELYQNWYVTTSPIGYILRQSRKDAILQRFQLDRLDFRPFFEDKKDCFSIIVPAASVENGQRQVLGFIKYEKKFGRVTLANACMQLPVESLVMGLTSKNKQDHLAGSHGEGLKVAALVMHREGYKVTVAANHCNWNFGLHGPYQSLRCIITPSRKMSAVAHREPANDLAGLRSQIDRDVMVVIGAGHANPSQPVSSQTFFGWLQVTPDIRGLTYPHSIIDTPHGDLLLDPQFQGKIFLHGLLLPMSTSGGKVFKFGYNFALGKFSRDRQRLAATREVADLVRRIWESALHTHEETLLPIYVNLLRNFPCVADVEQADGLLEPSTKARIWKHILQASQQKLFFYSERASAQVSEVISWSTRRQLTSDSV